MRRRFATYGLLLLLTGFASAAGAEDVTPTAKEFAAEGKNRAMVSVERPPFDERLDTSDLLGTLVKRDESLRWPEEPAYLYQDVDPVPLASYKVFAPWLNYFKQSMVFVLGRLDPGRVKIARWSVRLLDAEGAEIRAFTGIGQPPAAFTWNGRDRKFNPVPVGRDFVPEVTLIDYYGAKVTLPQRKFALDQFLWEEPSALTLGLIQDALFAKKGAKFSADGGMMVREMSHLLSQHGAVSAEIECTGPDADLIAARAQVLRGYFARENLGLRKIDVKAQTASGPATITVRAWKAAKR